VCEGDFEDGSRVKNKIRKVIKILNPVIFRFSSNRLILCYKAKTAGSSSTVFRYRRGSNAEETLAALGCSCLIKRRPREVAVLSFDTGEGLMLRKLRQH
jgi:hypothetical protein